MADTTWGSGPPDPRTTPGGLAVALGIPWSPDTRSPTRWAWDGATLHGCGPTGGRHSDDALWHEIGHWLAAEPHLRHRSDCGAWSPEQEEAAYALGRLAWCAAVYPDGRPPALTDHTDPVALARGLALLETVGIYHRRVVVIEAWRERRG